jgi:alkanesulfonate monooxygenase SsuD/methylene tetrahydromethanopterin reductase-like flavin-dependent oxidoreductase (luciferase family)
MSFAQYARLWRRAEDLGYDACYLTDHFVTSSNERDGIMTSIFEGPTLLAAMAALTTRVRIGINVVGNTFRNPGILAKVAVTLDHISNGRLELGLGSGHHQIEHEQLDIPFYTTGRRLRMLAETASILHSLFENQTTDFDGMYYKLRGAVSEPKPLQEHLPIIVGGLGEELTLRIVAQHADIWNIYLMLPPSEYESKLNALRRHCQEVGRSFRDIRRSLIVFGVVRDTEEDARAASRGRFLPDNAISGTPEQVAELLLSYVQLGISDFLFFVSAPVDERSIELMASQVAPLVRNEGRRILAASVD